MNRRNFLKTGGRRVGLSTTRGYAATKGNPR